MYKCIYVYSYFDMWHLRVLVTSQIDFQWKVRKQMNDILLVVLVLSILVLCYFILRVCLKSFDVESEQIIIITINQQIKK